MPLLPPTDLVGTYQNKPTNKNLVEVKLTWVAPIGSDPFDKYNIYRNDVKIADVDNTTLEYIDTDLSATVNYVTYYLTTWKDGTPATESDYSVYLSNYSTAFTVLIERLRRLLMDYPVDPRMIRWTDEDLIEYLNIAIGDINATPPQSCYTLASFPCGWDSLILTRAKFEAWLSRAGLEAAKEFGFSYGGVSLTIDRSGKYGSISQQAWASYNERLTKAKLGSLMSSIAPMGIVSSDLPFKIRTYAPRQYRVR